MTDHAQQIAELLKAHTKGMTVLQISASIGLNRNSAARYLDIMESNGQVDSRIVGPARLYTLREGLPRNIELELYKRALDQASCGVTIADARVKDMPLIYVNRAFVELTGYAASESIGRNCRFLQGPKSNAAALRKIRLALQREKPVTVTLTNYRKDGTQFRNELRIAPVRDDKGIVTHYIGVQTEQ